MADTLDLINTVRIDDLAKNNANRDMQYDLDKRAERLERRTGQRPMDWDEFNTASPSQQPVSTFQKIATSAALGALIIAAVMGGVGFFAVGVEAMAGGLMSGAMLGALLGGIVGVVDDQKPEIRKQQLMKYDAYLSAFEKGVSPSPSRAQEIEADEPSTKWREQAEKSKLVSSEIAR